MRRAHRQGYCLCGLAAVRRRLTASVARRDACTAVMSDAGRGSCAKGCAGAAGLRKLVRSDRMALRRAATAVRTPRRGAWLVCVRTAGEESFDVDIGGR